jgi:hypothetical protein
VSKTYPEMTPQEFERARQHFDLPISRFAVLIGVQWRQGQRYRTGASPVPAPVARLIRTAINNDLDAERIG